MHSKVATYTDKTFAQPTPSLVPRVSLLPAKSDSLLAGRRETLGTRLTFARDGYVVTLQYSCHTAIQTSVNLTFGPSP